MQLIKPVKTYLLKVFDLNEDELQKTLLLQLNIFLLITTLLVVKPTINSLFLLKLTANALPLAYILTAISAVIGSYFYDRFLERFPLNRVIELTILGCLISLIIFGIALNLRIDLGYLLFIPYIWVAIYGLLTTSQFWILANLVYNIREAKRVFGFIGAGAIAGGIFGGYLTSLLTRFIDSENLLFVAAFLLFFCLPITRFIWKKNVSDPGILPRKQKSAYNGESPLKLIKQSKLLTLMALVIGLGVLVAKLVDYQYSHFASQVIVNPEDLTSFFGFWFSTLSVVSLLIQLFLTKRIVGTFGVGKSLLWLPTGVLLGSIILLFIPELGVIVFIKIIDGSLKQSVNKSATELLSIPIPIDIKKKTKTFIDVVVDSIATGMAGLILIFFINGLNIHSIYVSIITILLIIVWIVFIFKLRVAYIDAFKKLLDTSTHKETDKAKPRKEKRPVTSILSSIIDVFESGSENQILHMLKRTLETPDERLFSSIKELLNHKSVKVKSLAIENLYFLKTEDLSDQIEPLIYDPDQELTTNAFQYLIHKRKKDTLKLFESYLNSEDESIKNATLIGLSLELNNNPIIQARFNFNKWLQKAIDECSMSSDSEVKTLKIKIILEAIGNIHAKSFYYIINNQLQNNDLGIVNVAIENAAKTKDTMFLDTLVSWLSKKETRNNAIAALHDYNDQIIDELITKTTEEYYDLDDAHIIPAVIETFGTQNAINGLIKLIDTTEHSVTIEAIESLKRLKWRHSSLKVKDAYIVDKILDECQVYQNTLSSIHSQIIINFKEKSDHKNTTEEDDARNGLMKILEQRLDRQLHRIFKFLGIKYPPNEIDPILEIIIHGEEEQRINAIEFLDNILDYHLKRELIPIAESALFHNEFSDVVISKLNLKVYSETECYKILLQRHDIKIKHAVLYLIEKTNRKTFIPLVQMVLNDRSENIRNQAKQTLDILKNAP
ncbi:NTP/NDP exchange transporter [Formosa sp. PL04]|uniref:NTP/NDP exchange transporter n=1 Tax=Formosa sp. PL04 TaxID=3081755 RepID=UPI00298249B5|nr:Npt1/Npt2 family nucleotide transporter [Formosa sp. PL04]MDW5289247.1 Npt1/Npt2 family nucleotide transporter [Formosa sp. PL04]